MRERALPVTLGTFPEEASASDDDNSDDNSGHAQLGMTVRPLTPDLASRLELPRTVGDADFAGCLAALDCGTITAL